MQVLQRFFNATPVRDVVTLMQASVDKWGDAAARDVYHRQGGLRLSDFKSSRITRLASELAEQIGLACDLSRCSARLQRPTGTYKLAWHQDCAPMGLPGGSVGMVAWVPLDPLDGTRPSLEIAEPEPPWPHHRDDRRFMVSVKEPAGSSTVLMGLQPGDVVLFSPFAPHRTWCSPRMANNRISLDMRFQ